MTPEGMGLILARSEVICPFLALATYPPASCLVKSVSNKNRIILTSEESEIGLRRVTSHAYEQTSTT